MLTINGNLQKDQHSDSEKEQGLPAPILDTNRDVYSDQARSPASDSSKISDHSDQEFSDSIKEKLTLPQVSSCEAINNLVHKCKLTALIRMGNSTPTVRRKHHHQRTNWRKPLHQLASS